VFDHLRSAGPWFVSIDDGPLSVLDGMSQAATVCGGFAEDHVVQAFVEGGFGDATLHARDTSVEPSAESQAFADTLRHLVPGLPHVSFVNSGAEANEKALALCRLHAAPDRTKVLAFEGSFHGRTLLALHATYSPAKRAPFELAGYEASFAPFPVWDAPHHEEPAAPSGFYSAAGTANLDELIHRFGDPEEDSLLAAEVYDQAYETVFQIALDEGIEIYELPPDELDRWHEIGQGVTDEWIAAREAEGVPAQDMYDAMQEIKAGYE